MTTTHVAIVADKARIDRQGRHRIRIRVTHKRKAYYKDTGFRAKGDQFSGEKFTKDYPAHTIANKKLSQLKQRVIDALEEYHSAGRDITPEFIKECLSERDGEKVGFWKFVDDMIKFERGNGRVGGTLAFYGKEVNKLRDYAGSKNISVTWDSVVQDDFLEGYIVWLRTKRKNKHNTIAASCKFMSKIFNRAVKKKIIDINPFHTTVSKPGFKRSNREHLTIPEIKRFEEYIYNSDVDTIKNVGGWFLFGCYTGLRHSDIVRFNLSGREQDTSIVVNTEKDEDTVAIPIHKKLRRLMNFLIELDQRVQSDQSCNRWLKVIAAGCGIKKHITFHCSRHTFAMTYLELNGSKDALQLILGHEKSETTDIYARISNKRVRNEMKAWDEVF